MPPTSTELIKLIEARCLFFTGRDEQMKVYKDLDYDAHLKKWNEWKAMADLAWLPGLIMFAHNLPIAEEEALLRNGRELDLAEIFGALTKINPPTVVATLIEALNADGEPSVIVMAFDEVGYAIRSVYLVPGRQTEDAITLLNKILDTLSPLADLIETKSDNYLLRLIDTLGQGIGALNHRDFLVEGVSDRAQDLLRRIVANTPPTRRAIHREAGLFLNPHSK